MITSNHTPPHIPKKNICRGGFRRTEDGRLLPSRPTTVRRITKAANRKRQKKEGLPAFLTANQLIAQAKRRTAQEQQEEWHYRNGYLTGWLHCARAVARLYRAGYVRAKDISTLLEGHDDELRNWRDKADQGGPIVLGEPKFTRPSWWELRQEVFDRDGHACSLCGSGSNLEAHHIEAVADGGLSVAANLTTLCRQCHRGGAK